MLGFMMHLVLDTYIIHTAHGLNVDLVYEGGLYEASDIWSNVPQDHRGTEGECWLTRTEDIRR